MCARTLVHRNSLCLVNMNIEYQSTVYHIYFPVAPFLPISLFFYHFLLTSPQKKIVFFQKPDIGNSWPGVRKNWSCQLHDCFPNLQRFHFQSEGKNNSTTESNEINERAGKLEKVFQFYFYKCSSSSISVNSSLLSNSIIPTSPAENSVGKESGLQS